MSRSKKIGLGAILSMQVLNVAALWGVRGRKRKPVTTTDAVVGTVVSVGLAAATVWLAS